MSVATAVTGTAGESGLTMTRFTNTALAGVGAKTIVSSVTKIATSTSNGERLATQCRKGCPPYAYSLHARAFVRIHHVYVR